MKFNQIDTEKTVNIIYVDNLKRCNRITGTSIVGHRAKKIHELAPIEDKNIPYLTVLLPDDFKINLPECFDIESIIIEIKYFAHCWEDIKASYVEYENDKYIVLYTEKISYSYNRRGATRYSQTGEGYICTIDTKEVFHVEVRDTSVSGLGLYITKHNLLYPGQIVEFNLNILDKEKCIEQKGLAEIVRFAEANYKRALIGLKIL